MGLTEEERFRFDLTGFMVRPAILSKDEVAAIVDQIDRIKHNPESLPSRTSRRSRWTGECVDRSSLR